MSAHDVLSWVLFLVAVGYTVWLVRDCRRDRLHPPRVRRAFWRFLVSVVLTVLATANVLVGMVAGW